ncbi:MAG: hypothetical protein J6386_11765 [Candidatus Synoicihabitans palmerolidicus]|nr:hypothetical protein [Candidatus Synoicihabitans palmerolidicus]
MAHICLAATIPAAPAGQLETGVPPFNVLGRETLGRDALPSDLKPMPDGRLLIVSARQLVFGDGTRWEVINRSPDDHTVPLVGVAVGPDGRIYSGMQGGFGEVIFSPDGTWYLQKIADWPAELTGPIAVPGQCVQIGDNWYWHSQSGKITNGVLANPPGSSAGPVRSKPSLNSRIGSMSAIGWSANSSTSPTASPLRFSQTKSSPLMIR